jgi:hypothetical protein
MPKVTSSFTLSEPVTVSLLKISKQHKVPQSHIVEHALLVELLNIDKYGIDIMADAERLRNSMEDTKC